MLRAANGLSFWLIAIALLVAGCFGAQALWHRTHHRYDRPNSGWYGGSVQIRFTGAAVGQYTFSLQGRTDRRWRWIYSTNIVYRSLQYEWHRFDSQAEKVEANGTLMLPSLEYKSSGATGILTRAVISNWLYGTTNSAPEAAPSIDTIFRLIEAAGAGTLPAPRHHNYYFEHPVFAHISHFSHGFGIGGFVYIWAVVWGVLLAVLSRSLRRRYGMNS